MEKWNEKVVGGFSFLLYILNTIFWNGPLFTIAFLKFIIPEENWRRLCTKLLNEIACYWIAVNNWNAGLKRSIRWDVQGVEGLKQDDWYLVISNHQTWVDILVLQKIFHRKIPFLKFFLKKELIWVPILGLAWWALDFPFMKRYSDAFLQKHPHLKGKDMETTRKACEKFKTMPIAVMNFVEGTRFTAERHDKQQSPFTNLLKPKAGGTAFVLSAMGSCINSILNVTIAYPLGDKSFWDFLCGRVKEIIVRVEVLPLKKELIGDYTEDPEFRARFQEWVNNLWAEKDQKLTELKMQAASRTDAQPSQRI
jgi:1-acyl-sn-glycerol-3-phosphate acyltransferase